jgi:hypothetical protein
MFTTIRPLAIPAGCFDAFGDLFVPATATETVADDDYMGIAVGDARYDFKRARCADLTALGLAAGPGPTVRRANRSKAWLVFRAHFGGFELLYPAS